MIQSEIEDDQESQNGNEHEDLFEEFPIKNLEKEEIRAQNKIRKKKVRQIKIKKPIKIRSLFSSPTIWSFRFTLYYLWNFILIIICFIIIIICVYIHFYLAKLWSTLNFAVSDDDDLEKGAIVLFCATIIPFFKKDITTFFGIPYASLPMENSHFYKPGPLLSFVDCYKAYWADVKPEQREFLNGRIKFFSISKAEPCKQISVDKSLFFGRDSCLTISIKSPFLIGTKKSSFFRRNVTDLLFPVVIYLTGRSYLENRPFLVSDSLVRKTKSVFVVINYRLNVLGFSNFDLMKSPRNIGFVDFLGALDFLNKYLHLFHGNKSRITLLAEESGATFALINMIMKKDRNMFSKMWLIDGSAFLPDPPVRSLFYELYSSKNILCNIHITSEDIFQCLQNYSSNILLKNSPDGWLTANNYFFYLPNLFEERQSIVEKIPNIIGNPLEVVMKTGSEIIDIPIVVMSKIDYLPNNEKSQFSQHIGNMTKKELFTRTRLGLLNYQTGLSQTLLHKEINLAYNEYIKFIENRSIFYQYMNDDLIPLGFEETFKAIISDIRAICPYTALAKYLQVNSHIVKGPIYRIIDTGNKYLEDSKESNSPCDLHFMLQDDSSECISESKDFPREYRETLIKAFVEFVNQDKIIDALQMEYPQNSTMKEFEDTFGFIGRLGFRTPGVREIGMLQACNVWKTGSDEYPMLKTSSKVN